MKEGRGKVGRLFAEVAERVGEAGLVVEAVESEKVEEREICYYPLYPISHLPSIFMSIFMSISISISIPIPISISISITITIHNHTHLHTHIHAMWKSHHPHPIPITPPFPINTIPHTALPIPNSTTNPPTHPPTERA